MNDANSSSVLDLATVKKWVKAQEKQFKALKQQLDKADDIAVVLKALDVNEPALRAFRNKAKKLQREAASPARARKSVLKEAAVEVKRFGKLLALV